MKEEPPPPLFHHHHHHHRKVDAFNRKKFTKPTAYVILLLLSYALGYLSSPSSNTQKSSSLLLTPEIPQTTTDTVLETSSSTETTTVLETSSTETPTVETKPTTTSDGDHYRFTTHCSDPVPSELVRQTILDRIFNGISPYDNFPPAHISPLLRRKRIKGWGSYGAVFENLIRKVQPKTIIEIGTFLGASAIHMAELTSRLGLKTQILCVDDFRGWPRFQDRFRDMKMVNGDVLLLYQFMQNVVSVNATDSILFAPFSTGSVLETLCEWGVYGDLIEVDAGHDFHSAWSDINRAYKILRPGGVIFGHDYFATVDNKGVRRAVNLFAKVNGLRIKVDGQHWVIHSA